MKVVINKCYGGFSLSYTAVMAYAKRKGLDLKAFAPNPQREVNSRGLRKYVPFDGTWEPFVVHYSTSELTSEGEFDGEGYFLPNRIQRNDPDLVAIVEELGDAANGGYAELAIVEIPDDVKWEIEEYDGVEWVAEQHRIWR